MAATTTPMLARPRSTSMAPAAMPATIDSQAVPEVMARSTPRIRASSMRVVVSESFWRCRRSVSPLDRPKAWTVARAATCSSRLLVSRDRLRRTQRVLRRNRAPTTSVEALPRNRTPNIADRDVRVQPEEDRCTRGQDDRRHDATRDAAADPRPKHRQIAREPQDEGAARPALELARRHRDKWSYSVMRRTWTRW